MIININNELIPFFNIYVVQSKSIKKGFKEINATPPENVKTFSAVTVNVDSNIYLIFKKKPKIADIAHEVSHLVDDIIEMIEGNNTGETRAYLQGVYTQKVFDTLKFKKK